MPTLRQRRIAAFALALLGLGACGPGPAPPRPQRLEDLSGPAPRRITFVGAYENRKLEPYAPLVRPSAVTVAPDGSFWLGDYGSGRLHVFDDAGEYYGEADHPPGGRLAPIDLANHGFLVFVLDFNQRTILRYEERGAFRDVFLDLAHLDPTGDIVPSAMDVDRDGRIAVADVNAHRVLITSPFLTLETEVGEYGSFEGQFNEPRGVAFGPDGVLYVSDRGNRRVQAFDRTGQPMGATPGTESAHPLMVAPSGLTTDRFGNVYVTDTALGVVHVLAPDLYPLAALGEDELADDNLQRPVDCAFGPDDRLFVVDAGRNALLVYDVVFP